MSNVTNFAIDNASGQAVRQDINSDLQALQSSNSKNSKIWLQNNVCRFVVFKRRYNLKIRMVVLFTEVGNIKTKFRFTIEVWWHNDRCFKDR